MTTINAQPIDMETIKRLNRDKGQYFFSSGSTRFFRSRYPQLAYTVDNKKAYFITSEQFDTKSPRLFTLRVCDLETGKVDTIGEFQAHATRHEALKAMASRLAS